MPLEDEIGPVTLRLKSPALSLDAYLDLQRVVWAVLKPRTRLAVWRGLTLWVLGGIGVGLLAGWLGFRAELWVALTRLDVDTYLLDGSVLLAGLLLALLPAAWVAVRMTQQQLAALRTVHAQSGELFAEHEILFGERGVLWRNAHRTTVIRWASFSALRRGQGQWLLIADHASAIWLPDAALAEGPGEAEVLAQIERHTGLKAPAR